ncbi:MAG: hypothetical protein IPK03_10260 [Bacteroidetes bacterium]|nr:hypothetical protein [Bacteroidota bacterium]
MMKTSQYFIAGILGVIFMLFAGCDSNETYDCSGSTCISIENGVYSTIEACRKDCETPNATGYNCTSGNCVSVSVVRLILLYQLCQSNCNSSSEAQDTIAQVGIAYLFQAEQLIQHYRLVKVTAVEQEQAVPGIDASVGIVLL